MPQIGVDSPFGALTIKEVDGMIASVDWAEATFVEKTPLLENAARQIAEYSSGERTVFDLPLALGQGQRREFLETLLSIPFGETRTYGDLGRQLGIPAQAIGQLCGQNPIPIIVPCHRVLAANGLGGFSGAFGIESKVALLRHEGAASLLI